MSNATVTTRQAARDLINERARLLLESSGYNQTQAVSHACEQLAEEGRIPAGTHPLLNLWPGLPE